MDASEQAVEDDRAWLRLAIAAADLVTWELNLTTRQITFSPNIVSVVGFPLATDIDDLIDSFPVENRAALTALLERALQSGEPFVAEGHVLHPESGERVWLRGHGQLVGVDDDPGAQGAQRRLIGVAQNITREKRRERDTAFRTGIQDDFTRLTDAEAILRTAGARIARHFGFAQLLFAEIDDAGTEATVVFHHGAPETDAPPARLPVADLLGDEVVAALSASRVVTIHDGGVDAGGGVDRSPFVPDGDVAAIFVLYLSEDRWRFVLAGHRAQPRRWREDEVTSLRELTSRLIQRRARADAETRRRADEERYRTLFESIDEGFCVIEVLFDPAGTPVDYRFLEVNPAFGRQSSLHEAAGKRARELIPDLEAFWFKTFGHVAKTGKSVRFINEVRTLAGRWFDVYAFRLAGPERNQVAVLFTDITARKRAEADVARLAAIVKGSHDAIFRCELDGTIVDWNLGARELYGYTAAEIVGRNALILMPPDQLQVQDELFGRVQRGEDIPAMETVRVRKDGTTVDVEFRPSAVRDAMGRIVGVGVIARDVTARKRLERAQDDFLAMASHDLRSPVTVLRGRAQLMRRRQAYDAAGIDAILEQARRIERLIVDLQQVVSLEAGAIDLDRAPTDLGQLARDAVERIQPQAWHHRIQVVVPEVPVVGEWDRDRFGQVLDNLIGNAVKYSPPGGEVVVRVTAHAREAQLTVTDHGDGIPPETLPLLFERFYRADGAGATSGLGLGLYIARMLVEAHGGHISAESEVGKGSVFTVVLPIA